MNLRIAIQNKGRLRKPSIDYLKSLGLKFKTNEKALILPCKNADIEILFVRNGDVPIYVEKGAADFGIVGKNVLEEGQFNFDLTKNLGFGICSLVVAAPKGIENLEEERIATSYPCSLKEYLKKKSINASIVEIRGSVEIAPALNLADAICDITQSGKTLQKNNLKILDSVFDSEACLISNSNEKVLLEKIR